MLFLIDLVLHCFAFDFKWLIYNNMTLTIEFALQLMAIWSLILWASASYFETLDAVKILSIIFQIRIFRFLSLLNEIEAFDVIRHTFTKFTVPFATMCLSLYTVYYIYANIGMLLWSGKISLVSKQA